MIEETLAFLPSTEDSMLCVALQMGHCVRFKIALFHCGVHSLQMAR